MGEMRDSDWSRAKILRSDWLGPIGAIITTDKYMENLKQASGEIQAQARRQSFLGQSFAL